jgi:hypothetical protein
MENTPANLAKLHSRWEEPPELVDDDCAEPEELSAEAWEAGYKAWVASYQGGF